MRDLARLILWPLGDLAKGDDSLNALITDSTFRACAVVATVALTICASAAILRASNWDRPIARRLGIVSLLSAVAAVLSVAAGVVATRV